MELCMQMILEHLGTNCCLSRINPFDNSHKNSALLNLKLLFMYDTFRFSYRLNSCDIAYNNIYVTFFADFYEPYPN